VGPPADSTGPPLLVVAVKGYPRVSETFVAQELAGLERRGIRLLIASLRHPYDPIRHPVHAAVRAPVLYLPEYLRDAPGRVLFGHARAFGRAPWRYLRAASAWLADLWWDPTPNRGRRFGQAGVLAAELPAATAHLHAHFLHTPASVTRYAARMRGLRYSLSAHAKDVWTTPARELATKLREARFTVTCTAQNARRLRQLAPGAVIDLVYHGLDRELFGPPPRPPASSRDGRDPGEPVRLLAVGRFQAKKGFDVLLDALARTARHVALTIVGYGPLEAALRAQAARLGLAGRVAWTGPLDQRAVLERYRAADLFVLAPRVTPEGDQDGLPNVVVEALSQGLPVVATRVAAIPEIVVDDENGRLVPPEDPAALAAALDGLAADPVTRGRLGAAALRTVAQGWDLEAGLTRLGAWLEAALGTPEPGGRSPLRPSGAPR